MSAKVSKADRPSKQQRSSGVQGQRTPSPEERAVQPGSTPLTVLSAADQNKNDIHSIVSEAVNVVMPPEENAVDASERSRRNAVLGQTDPGPGPGSKLDQIRQLSLGMPYQITLDAERASIAGSTRNLNSHDRSLRPIQIDANPGSHASTFFNSIAHLVSEKASQDETNTTYRRKDESSTSVIDAFLGVKWSHPRTAVGPESPGDVSEEEERRCHPTLLQYYPHYAVDMVVRLLKNHATAVRWVLFMFWVAYVIYAVVYIFLIKKTEYDWCNGGGLISWTSVVILVHLITFKAIIPNVHHIHSMQDQMHTQVFTFFRRLFSRRYVRVLAVALMAFLIVMVTQVGHLVPSEKQLIALCGYFVIILITYLLSVEPEEVQWGMVARNLLLQILVVYLMMVWRVGRIVLHCIATKIALLFRFSREAAWVVFSKKLPHMLSIELLSSLTLTGTIMHILYYTGVLQGFLHKSGIILELITGMTTVEAVAAALCTLFGGIETAVILEPYIVLLTMSELHTFITSGMASMTGVALAMYMEMGVDKVTLMTVNFATLNGVLAISKVMYPETDTSVTTYRDLKFLDRDEYSVIDAGVRGAIAVLRLLAQLVAVLIAFIALIDMGNDFIEWLLDNIGIHDMNVVGMLSVVLRPLIFLMGIEWQYTGRIARLFGTKTVINEYVAFQDFISETHANPMQPRERAVTEALLYGFSNVAHVGATIAYLTAVAPERRHDISATVPRALITAILANMLTAALVGALVSTSHVAFEEAFNTSQLVSGATLGNLSSALDDGLPRGVNASGVILH